MKKHFVPGDLVPQTGVYRVFHDSHRLMHEVAVLQGARFPLCKQCGNEVSFELVRAVKSDRIVHGRNHAIMEEWPEDQPPRIASAS